MRYTLIVGLCIFAAVGAASEPEALAKAAWLRDPVFAGVPVLDLFHREFEPKPEISGPTHVHTLFRKDVTLKETPTAATLFITGDDYYKFFINGGYVAQGPAPAYHFAYPYYQLDVTNSLRAGVNCLAAHVYYQGLVNRVWNSADNRSGFMLALELRYGDGSVERFVTGEDWRCFQLKAFAAADTIGYKTQFLENIDMRAIPRGWREAGFDDSGWLSPLAGRQDHRFELQATAPLQITRYDPVKTDDLGDGRYVYDFGQEIVGHTRLRVRGPAGHVVTVRHAEELGDDGLPRFEMRANCRYEEMVTLSDDEDPVEFYDYRAFRYLEVVNAPGAPEVWVDVRHHPFDAEKAAFTSDNKILEGTWTICRNAVQMGAQEVFVDCPSREKGQYLGDAVITGRSHVWLTADPSLLRKAILDFVYSRVIHPALMAVAPGSFMQEIADYSLQFPVLVLEYYRLTGDRATAEYAAKTVYQDLFAYFAGFENKNGLLAGIDKKNAKWVLVDWPENLRDGYDYDYSLKKGNTVLNAFYYGGLRAAAELETLLGGDGGAYNERADRLAVSFAEHLADPETGLYRDAPGSDHHSLHANAVPLAFGLTTGADKARMLELIRSKGLSCGVYIASYVIEGCFKAGDAALGFALLTATDEHSWSEMLRHGATTCMEAWGPDQKWNTSWLHPWGSCPIYLLGQYVFGLSPAAPGWKGVRVAPPSIPELPAMELKVPLPSGSIIARYTPGEGYVYTVSGDFPVEQDAPGDRAIRVVRKP
jgi:hypothetical protein